MRPLFVLLVALFALAGGCLGGDEADPPAGTTPTAATPEPTPPSPTPTTAAPPSPTPTTPAPPARKTVYNGSHDFTGTPPPPGSPPRTENFTVDPGYGTLEVRIAFTSTSGPTGDVSLSAGAKVRVLDPDGALVVECEGKDDPDCVKDVASPAPGAWTVEYVGSGTAKAAVTIAEAP